MAKGLSCGVEFMRGLLLVFNGIFVVFGLTLIGFGIYVKVDNNFEQILGKIIDVGNIEGQAIRSLAYIMIIGGVITLLISLFGCVGALWKNRCFLYMYAFILASLLILEFVGFIMAFVYKSNLRKTYEDGLIKLLAKALNGKDDDLLGAFHVLEKQMKCCGAANSSDYINHNVTVLPDSCKDGSGAVRTVGCSQAIIDFLNGKLPIFGGLLGGFLLIELLGLIAAIVAARAITREKSLTERYSS